MLNGSRRLQVAPMVDVTYKDFRQFVRILTRTSQLWTEMLVDNRVCGAKAADRLLDFGQNEHPIVCQLGGSSPESLARAARIVEDWGYDELNLNCGCPSDRVASGEFGASLMKKPELVRHCVASMSGAVGLPVTVKCRLGVDDLDTHDFTANFVRTVAEAGVRHFIIHARRCLLKGLTPDQNRKIPPLIYDRVYALCEDFPHLEFTLNGGVTTLEEVRAILDKAPKNLVGVMIGRAVLNNPCILCDVDRFINGEESNPATAKSRYSILEAYCAYLDVEHPVEGLGEVSTGLVFGATKHLVGLFSGVRGNRAWRQGLQKYLHDREVRSQGPAAVVRRVVAELEADPVAAAHLHEPLRLCGHGALPAAAAACPFATDPGSSYTLFTPDKAKPAGDLIEVLTEANQLLPQELENLAGGGRRY